MTDKQHRPLTYLLVLWYSYIFAATYVLYGAVSLILAVLDRNYTDLMTPLVMLMIGIVLVVAALGFRDLKAWGWYSLVVVHGLVILRAIFSLAQIDSVVLAILSLAALVCLFVPPTRLYLFGER
ncbi:hypothetical protein C3F09_01365 [candidate division GN15 bacterium]|uniref:Uncharacterized protein n=1 Tax=candidate division GN15 bacterium TaxID=2072418 RepID=A0A855XCY5_9BACT|nr:MAG: hypothetical protein C3F09_01365 [candidate division GN15 bacterium]